MSTLGHWLGQWRSGYLKRKKWGNLSWSWKSFFHFLFFPSLGIVLFLISGNDKRWRIQPISKWNNANGCFYQKSSNLWGSIRCRWRYWFWMIACCVFDALKISVLQNMTFSTWNRWCHLTICIHLREPHRLNIFSSITIGKEPLRLFELSWTRPRIGMGFKPMFLELIKLSVQFDY